MKNLFCSLMLLFALSTTSQAAPKHEIMDVDRAFGVMAAENGIQAAFRYFLAEDAVKLDGKKGATFGTELITASMPSDPKVVLLEWEPQDGMIAASEDLAYTWGLYTITINRDGKTNQQYGKYTSIWVKRGGEWKAILDIGNSRPTPKP